VENLGERRGVSPVKGQKLMDLLVERLAACLVQLSAALMDEQFPC
jgi:hypothetical protein